MIKRAAGIFWVILCVLALSGCTAENVQDLQVTENNAVSDTVDENRAGDGKSESGESDRESEPQIQQDDRMQDWENLKYGDVTLYNLAQEDKVCIRVEPSVLRDYLFYYYIPEDEDQEWIRKFMESLPPEQRDYEGMPTGMKETGWQIIWQGKEFRGFEGGYLCDSYVDEKLGYVECFVEVPKLCDYIQIMLQEKIDYYRFDPAEINNIISAKLDVCGFITNDTFYSQTITDEEILKKFEEWFSHAEYIYGGADCGNQDACLELLLESGERVRLSIATDSCPNFGINGMYYDYRPLIDWDNREFFECFDEIVWQER